MEILQTKKLKMTQVWKNDTVVPVTVLVVSIGDKEKLGNFKEGELVKITGTSKGKGFQGVVKRHGFHGGPRSHGQKDRLRAPGSIGATAPQRVIKGRKMAGHMGMATVSVKNIMVAEIRPDDNMILLRGAVPGANGGKVVITKIA